jgi:hypothetical protein
MFGMRSGSGNNVKHLIEKFLILNFVEIFALNFLVFMWDWHRKFDPYFFESLLRKLCKFTIDLVRGKFV